MSQSQDPRNESVVNWVDGEFVSKYQAAIPVFDSGFMHGKLVWSSPRLVKGRIFRFSDHLYKIRHSAELNFWPSIPTDDEIIHAVRETLKKNNMQDGVHIRIMITAGNQSTASMDLRSVVDQTGNPSRPRIIVAPEYRNAVYETNGISAMTSSYLRPGPEMVNQRSHDNNQNASSRACYEAKGRGVTTSLMYDAQGYLAEAFASHAAIVTNGELKTPCVRCCPEGVTRKVILELCQNNGIKAKETDLSNDQVQSADEIFIMGTMSGPVGVTELDGKVIGNKQVGPVTRNLMDLYHEATLDPKHSFPIFEL